MQAAIPKGNGYMQAVKLYASRTARLKCEGKWRYASSKAKGNGDMQAAKQEMEICKQPSEKWRYASEIEMRHLPVTTRLKCATYPRSEWLCGR